MKLFELRQHYNTLQSLLEDGEDVDIKAALDATEEMIDDKLEQIALLVKNLEADAKAIKEEEQRFATRRKTLENKIINIKDYLKQEMEFTFLDKLKRPSVTISIQKNPPKLVRINNNIPVPEEFLIVDYKTDTAGIKQALKNGHEVEGFALVQEMGLRIK